MTNKKTVHLQNSGSGYQVGEDEMHQLARLSAHFGGSSRASILRMAIKHFYEKTEPEMSEKVKKLKHK